MTDRRLAHHYADEVRPLRQAVPYRESQRRVLLETLADFVSGLAIIAGLIVVVLGTGAALRFVLATLPWSGIYIGVVGAGILGLCRAAARGER